MLWNQPPSSLCTVDKVEIDRTDLGEGGKSAKKDGKSAKKVGKSAKNVGKSVEKAGKSAGKIEKNVGKQGKSGGKVGKNGKSVEKARKDVDLYYICSGACDDQQGCVGEGKEVGRRYLTCEGVDGKCCHEI